MNGTLWNDYPMGERSGSFLLSDGDALKLSPNFHLLYRCDRHMEEDRFDMIQQIEREARNSPQTHTEVLY